MNLALLGEEAIVRLGERMALDFEGEQITNFQQHRQAKCLQQGFARIGMKQGDVILMCMMNNPLVFPAFQGIFRNGAVALPVMFLLAEPEIRYILEDSGAKGVLTDVLNLDKVRAAVQGLDNVRWIVVLGGKDDTTASPPEYSLETLLEEQPKEELPDIEEDDLAMLLYTAGTTGKPKGVMLTHGNLLALSDAAAEGAEIATREKPIIMMSAMPMAHIYGVGIMMGGYKTPAHIKGAYSVQMAWFEPEKFMQLIVQHQCNSMAAVPTMLILILNHPNINDYDLSCLDEIVCGAAPLPVEIARTFMDRYGCRIREIYGQTECVGIGSANRLSLPYMPGSCGKAYSNTELAIVSDDDNFLAPNEIGEVVLRGPTIMKGYYNRPEETAIALRNGWLHTGDMGRLDDEGWLYIVDRKKDMIIKGGENIFPAELENILFEIDGIAEAAVVGKPDPVYGENVIGFVVLKPDAGLSEHDIIGYMKNKTSSFKVPQKINFVDALPKSMIGKILRRELRKIAAEDA